MTAPSADSFVDTRWPESLRRFAVSDELRFRSTRPHLYVWIAAPGAVVLVLCGIAALTSIFDVTDGPIAIIVGIAAMVLGIAILQSCAYSMRGRMELRRDENRWVVVSRLGRWAKTRTFYASDVRHVETYDPGPDVIWPGSCGTQLRVHLRHRQRPIAIAAGLSLDDDVLEGLKQLLAPKLPAAR